MEITTEITHNNSFHNNRFHNNNLRQHKWMLSNLTHNPMEGNR
jgi:hypothetical protein